MDKYLHGWPERECTSDGEGYLEEQRRKEEAKKHPPDRAVVPEPDQE